MRSGGKVTYVQLQEGEVGIAVVRLALALLHDIVLEYSRRLRVVPVETIKNLLYVFRPLGRKVVCCSHDVFVDARAGWLVLKALSI
jgi:hypothetical protein